MPSKSSPLALRSSRRLWRALAPALALLALSPAARAHEPLFGVGPHTMFKGGVGAEIEVEADPERLANVYELAYGVSPNLTVTAQLPLVYRFDQGGSRFGVGDAVTRFKWRFWRLDSPGASDALALVGGIKLPSGFSAGPRPLGTGSTDFLAALTYGHEGRLLYVWADLRYLLTTEGAGVDRGDVLFYDLALGIRPFPLSYEQPDLVLLLEVNGRHIGSARKDGQELTDSGGDVIALGPALLLSYRNYMVKAGLVVPVWAQILGAQADPNLTGVIAVEAHF